VIDMPPARDSEEAVPVEGGASGAADAFDGNHTSDLMSWMLPDDDWDGSIFIEKVLPNLMDWTIKGHLAWAVFTPRGWRL